MMKQGDWRGVFPAITTPFLDRMAIDHPRLARHVTWLVEKGCVGIVALGSLGEAATLTSDEKISVRETSSGRRMRRADGAATVCLSGRLAGEQSTLRRDHQGDIVVVHVVQQPD